jgi:hypothetical protein
MGFCLSDDVNVGFIMMMMITFLGEQIVLKRFILINGVENCDVLCQQLDNNDK